MTKIYVSDLFKKTPNWKNYFLDFYDYKKRNISIDRFGRDINLNAKHLFHLHLGTNNKIIEKWKNKSINQRTTDKNDPASDFWLIYAYDDFNDSYLILMVAGPNVHNDQKFTPLFNSLSTFIASPWIDDNSKYIEEKYP